MQLCMINGSPRGAVGNTAVMLDRFGKGFGSIPGNSNMRFDLNFLKDHPNSYTTAFEILRLQYLAFPCTSSRCQDAS
jgi:multimeric flavodoxin WrbA